jgi:hypothetical protein
LELSVNIYLPKLGYGQTKNIVFLLFLRRRRGWDVDVWPIRK